MQEKRSSTAVWIIFKAGTKDGAHSRPRQGEGRKQSDPPKKEEEALQEKAYFARNLIAIICGKYDQMNLEYVTAKMRTDGGIRYIDIEIDDRNEEGSEYEPPKTEEEKRKLQRFLYQSCLDFLGEDGWHCIFDVSSNERDYDIGLIYCDYMAQEAGMNEQDYLDSFLGSIQEAIKHPVVMFVGNRVEHISGLSEILPDRQYRPLLPEFPC